MLVNTDVPRRQRPKVKTIGSLEPQLQAVVSHWMWVLGSELQSSGRAISPAQLHLSFKLRGTLEAEAIGSL